VTAFLEGFDAITAIADQFQDRGNALLTVQN
jgi:hypothetical protein